MRVGNIDFSVAVRIAGFFKNSRVSRPNARKPVGKEIRLRSHDFSGLDMSFVQKVRIKKLVLKIGTQNDDHNGDTSKNQRETIEDQSGYDYTGAVALDTGNNTQNETNQRGQPTEHPTA